MKKPIHEHTYIKFTGEFTDLKGMGYKFQKLFAKNYMQWCKYVDPEGYGHCIRVWKNGGDVEFDDLYDSSYLVLDAIRSNNMVKTKGCLGGTWYAFAINKKNWTIEPWINEVHTHWHFLKNKGCLNDKFKQDCTEEKYKETLSEYYDTWREYHISPEFVDMIKELDSVMKVVRMPKKNLTEI